MTIQKIKNNEGIVVPVSNTVILPGAFATIHLEAVDEAQLRDLRDEQNARIAIPLKNSQRTPKEEDFHRIGATFSVANAEETEKGAQLLIQVRERVEIRELHMEGGAFYAQYTSSPEAEDLSKPEQGEMLEYFKKVVREISAQFQGGEQYSKMIDRIGDINSFIARLSEHLPLSGEEKYELLSIASVKARSLRFLDHLLKQKEAIALHIQISEKFSERANKMYRESVLREQLKVIQDELNEGKSERSRKDKDYLAKIEEAGMPPDIREAALEELDKLNAQGPGSPESSVLRNYLEFLIQLPWKKAEGERIDLEAARRILDEQHYGLEKVKDRIIQHLAVMQLKSDKKGSILLLIGPPGTGKTSLGKSIAEALGRKYIRLSLGGIRDEAEIRGHRRTYVGAMPGRILQSIKKAGTSNPVVILDEVDKLMVGGFSGDPASALLEVLDPEQNSTFTDHYLDLPYDLSDVFFIATANFIEGIPGPLLDRMEVIHISSYTTDEKFHIGKNYLIPSVLQDHGLTPEQLVIEDDVLRTIIGDYTLEAGVRGLKKQLAALARVASEKIVSGRVTLPYRVRAEDLEEILGRQVSRHDMALEDNPPGVVTGLAWTPVGGEILFIEATDMPGGGEVTLTGKLGDVMKESARISLSLLKSRLPLNSVNFKERDLHIHVPSGAVPKDGPSAGIALLTALASLITNRKVDSRLAMTGEITLRGAVLPIGGLKEKLLGAQRAGIRKVLIPKDNMGDLRDVPAEVKEQLTVIPVETVEDVLKETLGISLPRIEHIFQQRDNDGLAYRA